MFLIFKLIMNKKAAQEKYKVSCCFFFFFAFKRWTFWKAYIVGEKISMSHGRKDEFQTWEHKWAWEPFKAFTWKLKK